MTAIQPDIFGFEDRRVADEARRQKRRGRVPREATALRVGSRVYPVLSTGHVDDGGVIYPVEAWVQIQKSRGLAVKATVADLGGTHDVEV